MSVLLELGDPRWRELVAEHGTTPFQHPAWAELLCECYGWRGFALAVEEAGALVAGLPVVELRSLRGRRRWVSLPFTDDCPPVGGGGAALVDALSVAARERDVGVIEVRSPLAADAAAQRRVAVTHVLDLDPDPGRVLASFSGTVRRNIRTAERSDVAVGVATDENELVDAYYRLHLATRRRLGVPVQPRRFFRLLWSRILEPGLGSLFLASVSGRPVAGAVYLHSAGTMVYKYGASDPEFWPLRPNNLLHWKAIEWAARSGYRRFDFGRTDFGDAGLRAFKAGWGGREETLVYSAIGAAPRGLSAAAGAGLAPIRLAPKWVCRLAGELLYRYAA